MNQPDFSVVPPIPPVGRTRSAVDDLAPDGADVRLILGEPQGATAASLCEITIAPGHASRPVKHRRVEELWYVLTGRGEIWRCPPNANPTDVAAVAVGPGDALTIPTGWTFQFRASGDADFRFLCYTSPPWPGPDEARPSDHGAWTPTV